MFRYKTAELEHFMEQAMNEGRKALPECLPNPPVGCVLVQNKKIIARGHTQKPSLPHAEAMALAQVEGELYDVDVFVTLEPCSFQGRTPSCAQTLISRGVRDVYVSVIDPDPKNQGAGIELLRDAGIGVHVGILQKEVLEDLNQYLIRS